MGMTVGRKLAASFGAVVVVSLLGSTISIINFLRLNQANGWNVHSYQVQRTSDDMLTSMVNMETGVRGFVASGDANFLEPYNAGRTQFGKSLDLARSLTADNPAQQQRLQTLAEMQGKVQEVDENLLALRRDVSAGRQPESALTDYFRQGNDKQFMDRYRSVAAEFSGAEQTLLDSRTEEVAALASQTKLTLATAGIFTILLAIVLGTVITKGIMRSLGGEPADAAAVAGRIAEGDLSVAVPVPQDDRVSLMASLESMRQQLKSIVAGIQLSAESIRISASEIAQGNVDLSQRTEEQAASLEETAASMEELTATVRQNTENARQANALAGSACEVAIRGGEVVHQVVETMQSISQNSDKVAEIISVIEGIAFQTNILALNAAVEAARAGDQGRGFAVVAGEVRTLAQRSASAAREIKDLITRSVERVAEGSEQVGRAGSTMDDIVASVRQVTTIMGEIATASGEQGTGIEQVNVAVSQMDEVTQQNAALVEQATAAAQAMAEQATTLRAAVTVFRIGNSEVSA
ncbi:methyl-accepting chemotaxis protein [Burkholderia sp. WP9]|uniref:methyl-accepting chemotaxis protein n=1 Tax=Burkholderia sp. WP9 TaxID=1500263 RepID=UPI0008943876|nr:methyl-accepting chemotaxis protein [Burkholderia sp. WP9]SEF05788.1 methyl-accepting chemotaxis protein [Burkholderia sp. WP9]